LTGKPFTTIPSLLLEAFHKGQVVLFDEINTVAPLWERLLNHLMSGTDLNKRPATCPGFFIIGTMNSASQFAGRMVLSAALANRFTKYTIAPYSQNDLQNILEMFQLDPQTAANLAQCFLEEKKSDPSISLRDLLLTAEVNQKEPYGRDEDYPMVDAEQQNTVLQPSVSSNKKRDPSRREPDPRALKRLKRATSEQPPPANGSFAASRQK
jgi:MoxR-like ATPase